MVEVVVELLMEGNQNVKTDLGHQMAGEGGSADTFMDNAKRMTNLLLLLALLEASFLPLVPLMGVFALVFD